MNLLTRLVLSCCLLMTVSNSIFAQESFNVPPARQAGRGGWTDPALNHNMLIQQQTGDGVYKMIGSYKVVGTLFLYREHQMGDMFSSDARACNIFIGGRYNIQPV